MKGKKIISNTIEAIQNSWEFIFSPKKKKKKNSIVYWTQFFMHETSYVCGEREKKLLLLSYFSKFLPEHICLNSHLIADPCPSLSLHFYPYSWSKCKRELRESERTGLVHIIKPLSGSGDCCMCVCVWVGERELCCFCLYSSLLSFSLTLLL